MLHQQISHTQDLFAGLEPAGVSDDMLALLPRLLRYEPDTGRLYWLERPVEMFHDRSFRHRTGKIAAVPASASRNWWNTVYAGREAFRTTAKSGYKTGSILAHTFLAHRVIWALVHGDWPEAQIDHINGDRSDNRLANLRAVSLTENRRNAAKSKNNTSGVMGVYWSPKAGKWFANIMFARRRYHLGFFERFDDAVAARKAGEARFGFHPNHGRDQTRASKADAELAS